MNPPSKDDILTALALTILLFSAMMTWTISSWIILVAIIIIAIAWYFRVIPTKGRSIILRFRQNIG
ncbi:MAG: hypothetical protein M0Q91_05330 [Methanoregula sp.]|nr:hypothetical protein [Methanoregula sp.]